MTEIEPFGPLNIEIADTVESVDLTAAEAEAVTARIRGWVNAFPAEDVVRAYRGRVWIALAYSSWDEWCECELGGLKLPAPQRRQVVAELAGQGMSNRAIAEVVGASEGTVRNDLDAGAQNYAPGDVPEPDRKVAGKDGRSYPRPKPKPEPVEPQDVIDAEIVDEPRKPRRSPLPEAFERASRELRKAVEKVARLADDDRFGRNLDQIAGANLADLIRARDALMGVIESLDGAS